METLPDELIINEILGRLTISEILEGCVTDRRFAEICQSDSLWILLIQRDFPHEFRFKPSTRSWREYYFVVLRSPILPVYFYEDPIEWIRLTPYNISKVIRLINELKKRHNVLDYTILFTDQTWMTLASVIDDQVNIINHDWPIRKIVLLRSGETINGFSAIRELTSANPQNGHPWPLSGHNIESSFYLVLGPPRRYDEIPGSRCYSHSPLTLMGVVQYLNLNEELAQLGGNLNRRETKKTLCNFIYERLREMGRILDEVVPPEKPLLE